MIDPTLGDPIIYWILRLILFTALAITGYRISYKLEDQNNYWRYTSPVIVVYSLVEGLRYMRSWDYPHYMQDLTGELFSDYKEVLYILWTDLFKFTGLPFWVGFVFYSAILIISFCCLVKLYPKSAVWAFPLFLIIPSQSTNLVRMYLAMAFVLFGIYYIQTGRKKIGLGNMLASVGIHFSVLPIIFILLFLLFRESKLNKRIGFILISSYIALFILWDASFFDIIAQWVSSIDISEYSQGQVYFDNAENWFGTAGDITSKYSGFSKAGFIMSTLNMIVPLYIIYYSFRAYMVKPQLKVLFWCTVVAFMIKLIANDMEIYMRFYYWMTCLIPIMIGEAWSTVVMRAWEKIIFVFVVGFYYYVAYFLYFMFVPSMTGYGFIWDK